ncbi:hypothetical protein GCM10010346_43030 [Streptomyces chryseus]|uniref:Uncharacterized protein n=1 Tax=Streptomyces chryseus TaxID=68186 RepID=A0ABQ3DVL0_9ACTN|nr:hypothetical protein GCM10010346_43030 [Streptomyces chryseus]
MQGIGVAFEPPGDGAADPAGPVVLRLCVDGKCEERTEPSPGDGTPLTMSTGTSDDVQGGELDVRFSVVSAQDDRVTMKDTAKVRMTKHWPNGKECDGEGTWAAWLTASPDQGLVVRR